MSAGFLVPNSGGLSLALGGTPVQNWTTAGPVVTQRSQQWATAAVGSAGSATALTFSTPTSTPAALTGYLTYAQSATNGDTWTINQAGTWAIKAVLNVAGGGNTAQAYLTRGGSTTLTPTTGNLLPAVALDYNTAGQTGTQFVSVGGVFSLAQNDVVRISVAANNAATTIGTGGVCTITFTFLGASATSL